MSNNEHTQSTKTTKEAFSYFVENVYPELELPSVRLRVLVHRYKTGKAIPSERKMIKILTEYNFQPVEFEQVPVKWAV